MPMRRRTKIILFCCVGVLLFLVAALSIWIAIASRDIPPQDFSDLKFPFLNIPAEENAHTWFQAAAEKVVWGDHERAVYDRLRTTGTVDVAEVEAILATNAPALALLRRGLACNACQPPLATNLESFGTIHVGPYIETAKVLSLDRRWKTNHHDIAGAFADCIDLLRFGELESRQSTTLIQYLVAQAICAMGIEHSRSLVTTNRLDDVSLQTLDKALQNFDVGRAGLPNALRGEFLFLSGVMEDIRWGRIPGMSVPLMTAKQMARLQKNGLPRFLFKPNETRLFYAQGAREVIHNVPLFYREMTFHDLDLDLERDNRWHLFIHGNAVGKILASATAPALKSPVEMRCRMECDRTGLRLLIACQRYERQNGRLPTKLDDLVPAFVEAVPRDPFDGQPMRYSAERRIVWSVGKNLKDDNGSKLDSSGNTMDDAYRKKMLDYVIDIPPLPK